MANHVDEYTGASQLVAGLRRGELSSRELLEAYLARIEAHNPGLNAVVALDADGARRAADRADAAARRGESLGPLHGLPMTIKDTYEVPGMPCTAGSPKYRQHLPRTPAVAVRRLQEAGAVIFGKTNVPLMAGDVQSYNAVYGTSNNPWNRALTPGGSSGGAAAALAAGFTPLELGSDIGGSIRIPAHFCGVYGHKTTHGIVSLRGHIPGPPGMVGEPELAVAGPMARSAEDLELMLDVIAATPPAMQPGWQLTLPPSPKSQLKDFRVLLWLDDSECGIDSQMAASYRSMAAALRTAGAQVTLGSPSGWNLDRFYPTYLTQLSAAVLAGQPQLARRLMGLSAPLLRRAANYLDMPHHADKFLAGANLSHVGWMVAREKGRRLREAFLTVFQDFDVILAPPTLTTAFAHDHSPSLGTRRLSVDGVRRHYIDMFMWIAPATLMGLPATSAPVGLTATGSPVNVQIIGAPYADKTTIAFAGLLATVCGGFQPPPGFAT